MDKEGGFVNRPPLLDGSNYDYWKSSMSAFLKSIDNKTWKTVLKSWEHHVQLDADGNRIYVLKPEEEWSAAEDELALGNSKALNAMFNGVDKNMFRLIKQYTVAKDAWEILKTAHEGTTKVKSAKIQLLTTKFANIKMLEDESIQDYHLNILDIANSFESFGEKISYEKLVRKILRSLPKRFDMKVTAIEEAQDISSLKVDELIGSLQNFEITVNSKTDKKGKGVAFTSSVNSDDAQGNYEDDEDMAKSLALLGRQFKKIFKRFDRRSRPNGQNIRFNIDNQPSKEKMTRPDEVDSHYKGVQCHECEGYGHIRTECATFLKKQKKSLDVSWSDGDDSNDEVKAESANHVSALAGRIMSDTESCEEEMSYDELAISYYDLMAKNSELTQKVEEQARKIAHLGDEKFDNLNHISELNDELSRLNH